MDQHDRAVDVLKDGLIIDQSFDERYQIFHKITEIVSRCKGIVECIFIILQEQLTVKFNVNYSNT